MPDYGVAALIVAAGMSSRMKAFKPLLKINSKTIIETSIATLRSAGINEIMVVTGNCAAELESVLKGMGVSYVRNENYAETTMFESAKLGFKQLRERCKSVFFLPADIPLFKLHSLQMMLDVMAGTGASIVQPRYKGKGGHPLLIKEACFLQILEHDGRNGLRGALAGIADSMIEIELPDPGLVMDADTPEEYENMCKYAGRLETPSVELCGEIQKWFKMQPHTISHCAKVAEIAREFAVNLVRSGHKLDYELVEAGALLHDIAKGSENHAEKGGEWLQQLGYSALAHIVAAHTDLPEDAIEVVDERAVVYLADKLVKGDIRISLEERFSGKLEKFMENELVKEKVLRRMTAAKRILELIHEVSKGA